MPGQEKKKKKKLTPLHQSLGLAAPAKWGCWQVRAVKAEEEKREQDRRKDNRNPFCNSPNCNPLGLMVCVCGDYIFILNAQSCFSTRVCVCVLVRVSVCACVRRKATLYRSAKNAGRDLNPRSLSHNSVSSPTRSNDWPFDCGWSWRRGPVWRHHLTHKPPASIPHSLLPTRQNCGGLSIPAISARVRLTSPDLFIADLLKLVAAAPSFWGQKVTPKPSRAGI